jgi:hypothetical protein
LGKRTIRRRTTREAAWQYLLEKAETEEESQKLLNANKRTRNGYINAVLAQFGNNQLEEDQVS